ncbi:MAG TPA: hypothetical protein VJ741_12760, partial [Solirubrobacteraceae bacterium]|nr:hypothetical protein [Solirubrobacteraceae bacterium]
MAVGVDVGHSGLYVITYKCISGICVVVAEDACIYRAPMRARNLDVPAGAGAEYGLASGVVGIGPGRGEKAARLLHRFATVPTGGFVWTRDRPGNYHLGRIAGAVREDGSPAARAVGIVHVREANWLPRAFSEDEVPPAVAQTFARGGRNFQRTHDSEA